MAWSIVPGNYTLTLNSGGDQQRAGYSYLASDGWPFGALITDWHLMGLAGMQIPVVDYGSGENQSISFSIDPDQAYADWCGAGNGFRLQQIAPNVVQICTVNSAGADTCPVQTYRLNDDRAFGYVMTAVSALFGVITGGAFTAGTAAVNAGAAADSGNYGAAVVSGVKAYVGIDDPILTAEGLDYAPPESVANFDPVDFGGQVSFDIPELPSAPEYIPPQTLSTLVPTPVDVPSIPTDTSTLTNPAPAGSSTENPAMFDDFEWDGTSNAAATIDPLNPILPGNAFNPADYSSGESVAVVTDAQTVNYGFDPQIGDAIPTDDPSLMGDPANGAPVVWNDTPELQTSDYGAINYGFKPAVSALGKIAADKTGAAGKPATANSTVNRGNVPQSSASKFSQDVSAIGDAIKVLGKTAQQLQGTQTQKEPVKTVRGQLQPSRPDAAAGNALAPVAIVGALALAFKFLG